MKRLAITMGEPGGVGPEVALKAVRATLSLYIPLIVGDPAVIEEAAVALQIPFDMRIIAEPGDARADLINLIDTGPAGDFTKGAASAAGGRASVAAIRRAVELAMGGDVDAIVTAPISKEALRRAGYPWPGHTEMLAELTGTSGTSDYRMMLLGGAAGPPLRVILATTHIALKEVPSLISRESVLRTIRLSMRACRMLSIFEPRIAVAGLNPHAGEAGMFGDEEINIITPAIMDAQKEGIPATGPYPPDTVFYRASKGEFDIVVCMYHDQGLIPLKLLAFETGVNVTVGLPIIRTSPDHGTAYDIAWRGLANPSSMIEAVKMALRLKSI